MPWINKFQTLEFLSDSTILCDVEFPDGAVKPYSENIIAGNILNQVNADGYHHQIIDSILEHSKDKRVVEKKDKWIVSKLGNRSRWKSNVGWKFQVKWKDVPINWIFLKDLKESIQIQISSYVTACGIQDEPSFAWWVPFTLCNRDRVIAPVNSRVRKFFHKYGIGIPTSIDDVIRIDRENNNTFWQYALNK